MLDRKRSITEAKASMASSSPSLNSGMSNMSMHSDILSADVPSDPASKAALVNELKNRARVSIQSRNYPAAEMLYSKAITVMESNNNNSSNSSDRESSILYANRSLVWLQMNKLEESLRDAEEATSLDASYVKGFWRRGQALVAMGRYPEATVALESAVALEPTNKALKKEIDKCRKLADAAHHANVTKNIVDEKKETEPVKKNTTTVKKTSATKNTTRKSTTTMTTTKNDTSEFTQSDHIRGYKIVGGKKTSFFHHEQTEEEKRLIGDIAPKRIDPSTTNAASTTNTTAPSGSSAWNKAGTWEEKDVTTWATDALTAQCLLARYELPPSSPCPGGVATITKVKRAHGHASVATARGKRRYIYEFDVELEWTFAMPMEEQDAKGTMRFPDIDGTCDQGEYEMNQYRVDASSPTNAGPLLERFVKNGGLRDEVIRRIDEWVELFKCTYS